MTSTDTTSTTGTQPTATPDVDQLRDVLLTLLTKGQHHDGASTAVLTAIGKRRQEIDPAPDPTLNDPWEGAVLPENVRFAQLTGWLSDLASTFTTTRPGSTDRHRALQSQLTSAAAVALAWLDHLARQLDEQEPPF